MSVDRFWILIARKLSGESSVEEIRELDQLLRLHPHLYFSVEIITNLWKQHPKKAEKQLESSYAAHIDRMKNMGIPMHHENKDDADTYLLHGSRKNRFFRNAAIAASLLILIIAGVLYMSSTKPVAPLENTAALAVSTKYGSRTNLQLPDGSKVWLNSGSTLTYNKQFGKDLREVILSGEAFFDVISNPEKPFIIHTSSMDIKVLGTQFNVKSYPNDKLSEASLIHGSIEVSLKKRGSQKIFLEPNEKIVVPNDRIIETEKATMVKNTSSERIFAVQKLNYSTTDSTIIETSWLDHKLIFQNESFEDIAIKMERWYGMAIKFDNTQLQAERLTGTLTNENIDEALEALRFGTNFHYTKRDNTIIITK